jgi:hypothetical protein
MAEHRALRVAAVSLAGALCLGFCADPAIVEDLQSMADGTELEAASLIAAADRDDSDPGAALDTCSSARRMLNERVDRGRT